MRSGDVRDVAAGRYDNAGKPQRNRGKIVCNCLSFFLDGNGEGLFG